ncbi:MAG: hypothetical protein ACRC2O_17920, partial [Chitinophagaceae bacterium]
AELAYLRLYSIIRKCLSLFLLVIFTFSITPKPLWHSLFAGHVDVPVNCDHPNTSKHCLHPVGFDCHYDNLVVNADYFPTIPAVVFLPQKHITLHLPGMYDACLLTSYQTQDNKGPPARI